MPHDQEHATHSFEKKGILGKTLNWAKRGYESVKGVVNNISKGVRSALATVLSKSNLPGHLPDNVDDHAIVPNPPAANPEIKEVPEQKEVTGSCNEEEGLYVGLNKKQREALGVEEGRVVEMFDEHKKSLGYFMVGKGKKAHLDNLAAITANDVPKGSKVTLHKVEKNASITADLKTAFGIENVPAELQEAKAAEYRTMLADRDSIIRERFKEDDPKVYLRVPMALAALLGFKKGGKETMLEISKQLVTINGHKHEGVILVPGGAGIGVSTAAAEKYDISRDTNAMLATIEDGTLVLKSSQTNGGS